MGNCDSLGNLFGNLVEPRIIKNILFHNRSILTMIGNYFLCWGQGVQGQRNFYSRVVLV